VRQAWRVVRQHHCGGQSRTSLTRAGAEVPRGQSAATPEGSGRKPQEHGGGASNLTACKDSSRTRAQERLAEIVIRRSHMMAAYDRVVSNRAPRRRRNQLRRAGHGGLPRVLRSGCSQKSTRSLRGAIPLLDSMFDAGGPVGEVVGGCRGRCIPRPWIIARNILRKRSRGGFFELLRFHGESSFGFFPLPCNLVPRAASPVF
jgi:hypothetical protein